MNILTSTSPSLTNPYWCLEVYWWQTGSGPAMQVATVLDELLLPLAAVGYSYPGHQRLLCPKSLMLIVHQCSWSLIMIKGGAFAEDLELLLCCSKLLTVLTCWPQCAWRFLFYSFLLALYSHYIISAKECSLANIESMSTEQCCLTVWLYLSFFFFFRNSSKKAPNRKQLFFIIINLFFILDTNAFFCKFPSTVWRILLLPCKILIFGSIQFSPLNTASFRFLNPSLVVLFSL